MYRKCWTIPDRVFDILDTQTIEVEVEVVRAIRAYHRYFDENCQDDGFDVSTLSAKAQSVFWRVYDELHEANERYAAKCAVNQQNALAGVEKRQKKQSRKEKKKEWYQANKEKVNQKRRKSSNKSHDSLNKNVSSCLSSESEKVSSGLSSGCPQGVGEYGIAKNAANALIGSNGLNNIPTLHSGILLERGIGGKPSYPQEDVQNSSDTLRGKPKDGRFNNNRTSGLSCSKAEQTAQPAPFAVKEAVKGSEELRGNMRQFRQFGITERWQSGRAAVEAGSLQSCPVKLRPLDAECNSARGDRIVYSAPRIGTAASSARKDCAPTLSHNEKQCARESPHYCLKSAPHTPSSDEVLITKNFKIDFSDTVLSPYAKADKFLREGVEKWMIKNKLGCSIEKKWLARQIYKFAQRQGKLELLMGIET
ncbi:MAG: hypothetical protein IJ184_07270 [Alphaproteobacteria bacterium]|nr:hypothetical protein [Alphaproteobacteria bacterium]